MLAETANRLTKDDSGHMTNQEQQPLRPGILRNVTLRKQADVPLGKSAFESCLLTGSVCCVGLHVDELATLFACGEYNYSVDEGEESVILAHADIETGMVHCATLAFDDIARLTVRTTKNFHTKSFAF